jgi:hypothetical protein
MPTLPTNAAALRQWLAERSPDSAPRREPRLPTGLPALDAALGGGLTGGALTEIVSAAPSSGGTLVQAGLLQAAAAHFFRVALVDAVDAFDPQSFEPTLLHALIWVRCRGTADALQAADLAVRDANLGLVLVDLRGCAPEELRRVAATSWYRLQRAAETSGTVMVVQTERALVPSAAQRVVLRRSFPLSALDSANAGLRHTLLAQVEVESQRNRWMAEPAAAVG